MEDIRLFGKPHKIIERIGNYMDGHYSTIIYLLFALAPLAAVFFGKVLGKSKISVKRAAYGSSLSLLIYLGAVIFLFYDSVFYRIYSLPYIPLKMKYIILFASVLAAISASVTAFKPSSASFGAGIISVLIYYGIIVLQGFAVPANTFTASLFFVPALFFNTAGFCRMCKTSPAAESVKPVPPAPPVKNTVLKGTLTVLTGSYSGSTLELYPEEEITIGSDPSLCQLILDSTEIPPRFCSVIWSQNKTYLINPLCDGILNSSDGTKLVKNFMVRVDSDTVLCLDKNGEPIIQLN